MALAVRAAPRRRPGPAGRSASRPGPEERDPAVVAAEAAAPHPGDLAHRAELVEQPRLVARDAGRQDVALQHGRRDRRRRPAGRRPRPGARARPCRGTAAASAPGPATGATPCQAGRNRPSAPGSTGSTSRRSRASDRRRSSRSTSGSHHSRSAPPGRNSPRSSEPAREQPLERVLDDADRQAPAARRLGRQERPVGPRPAGEQALERARRPARGTPPGRRPAAVTPDAVAVARDVLDRDPALLAGDPDADRAPGRGELGQPRLRDGRAADGPGADLGRRTGRPSRRSRSWTWSSGRRLAVLGERLERQLEVGERLGVEQLAQLLLAEQLAQQVAVQRQRAGPALGQRRVAVVHVGRDVVEQQAARERAGLAASRRRGPRSRAARRRRGSRAGRQVEHVRQALAVRLDEDREAAVAAGDGQQVRRALALLPERRPRARAGGAAAAGPGPRSRGSGSRTAPSWRPARRRGPRPRRRRGTAAPRRRRGSPRPRAAGSRCRRRTRSSGPRARAAPGAAPRCASDHGAWTRPPNGVRRRQPPVAELVAEALDDDPPVGRQGAGRLALVLEVGEQVLGRAARRGRGARAGAAGGRRGPSAPRRQVAPRPRG